MGLFQRLKNALTSPPEDEGEIVASFYMVELEEEATGNPALMVYISTPEREFLFLENKFVGIKLNDQQDQKTWDLATAFPYEGEMPWA